MPSLPPLTPYYNRLICTSKKSNNHYYYYGKNTYSIYSLHHNLLANPRQVEASYAVLAPLILAENRMSDIINSQERQMSTNIPSLEKLTVKTDEK